MKKLFLGVFMFMVITIAINVQAADVFTPYLTKTAPKVVNEIKTTEDSGVGILIKEIQYASLDGKNTVFAYVMEPLVKGTYPGIAFFHGGSGSASGVKERAMKLAQKGYIVIVPDLPGIAEPSKCPMSEGSWKERGYNQATHMDMKGKAENSGIFEGEVAAIDAVYLLRSLSSVDSKKIGIVGSSWGGYTVTMIGTLLGDDINAIYSEFGCAYYNEGTHWSKNVFPTFGVENEKLWMENLDASVRISNLKAPYYIEAPTNDSFFWPTAVMKTLENINGEKNKVFTPNMNHQPYISGENFLPYFDYYLKGLGKPYPKVTKFEVREQKTDGIEVYFEVDAALPLSLTDVYTSDASAHWNSRQWYKTTAQPDGKGYIAKIANKLIYPKTSFYVLVEDNAKTKRASSDIVTVEGLEAPEPEVDSYKINETIIVDIISPDCKLSNPTDFLASGLASYDPALKTSFAHSSTAKATYAPSLKAGFYRVSLFNVVDPSTQASTPIEVISKNGSYKTELSTADDFSQWKVIGIFEFEKGANGSVNVMKNASDAKYARFSGVKFELIDGSVEVTSNAKPDPEPVMPDSRPVRPNDKIAVLLKDKYMSFPDDQKPQIMDDRTLVSFRAIFEALGLTVGFDEKTSTVTGTKEGIEISLVIGSNIARLNGQEKILDVAPMLLESRTFVPLRFIAESLGNEVSWDDENQTVIIK